MKKKLIATSLSILGIVFIGLSVLYFLDFFKPQNAGILIESDPVATVFIDNQEVGKTPYEAEISPKEIMIKIKPESVDGQKFDDYETKVNLVSGIKTIVMKSFRQDEEYSSGVIVSFEKVGSGDSFVTVVSVPDNAQVLIDDKVYGYTPLRIAIPGGDHNLLVTADKYFKKQLPIRVYKGYKLTAFVKLAKSDEPQPAPAPVFSGMDISERIKINETDVGFLRVRSGASIGFPEVAQVKPTEEYDVIEEGENGSWYKIKVGEVEGWVSSEFVTKLYIPVTEIPE
jgi:hypothetical protein